MTSSSYQPHQWVCDVCKKPIQKPEDGYVVWNDDGQGPKDILVIHQGDCDDDSRENSAPLTDFLGANGIARLTAMMSNGPLIADGPRTIADLEGFTDFFRRMQLPYYEEARRNFKNSDVRADFHGANEIAPYLPHNLKTISEYPDD